MEEIESFGGSGPAGSISKWGGISEELNPIYNIFFRVIVICQLEATDHYSDILTFGCRARQFRLTYVFKRSRAPFVARDLVSSAAAAVPYNNPWRTAAARPGRKKFVGLGFRL